MYKNDLKSYWEERLSVPNIGIEHVGHAGLGYAYNYWLYKARYACMDRAFRSLEISVEEKNVLELGVGSGAWTSYWQSNKVKELTGIDITAASVKQLKRKFPQYSFFQADITQNIDAIQGLTFDLVTAFDVLFHIIEENDFRNAIMNIMSYLRPEGLAIITDSLCSKPWGPTFHEYHRSYDQYILEFQRAGLVPVHIEPTFYTMTTPLCANNSLPSVVYTRLVSRNLRLIRKIASNSQTEKINHIIGCFLFTIDRILGKLLPTGPSLKVLLIRKT